MNLNNLKISTRLGLGFGMVLLLLLLIVGISYQRLVESQRTLEAMEEYQRRSDLATNWTSKTLLNINRAVAIAKASGAPEVAAYFDPEIKRTTAEISELQAKLHEGITSDEGKALFAAVATRRQDYIKARDEVFKSIQGGDQPAAQAAMTSKMLPTSDAYLASIVKLQDFQAARAKANVSAVGASLSQAGTLLIALALVSLAIGAGMAWLITRSVTSPLRDAMAVSERIAASDLSQDIASTRKDELGTLLRSLAAMQTSLRGVVTQVRGATDSISTASAEIATGNADLSARTEQTASNLQQTAASMEQLTGTVKQSADAARQASQLASSSAEVAARGGQVVSQVVSTMDEINASSKKIADIISVIDGIAFQTNILALNAAVEAARAGEQGRGFAVVAGEVRSLAGRSAEAAKEIKGLIGASVERVEAGSRLVADAGQTMQEIVGSVQRVADIIGEITAAAAEQSDGIGQVNGAVVQLDQMTQQNAALVEQSAAAAESLKDQAGRLAEVVGTFKLGAHSPALAAHRPTPRTVSSSTASTAAKAVKPAASTATTHRVTGPSRTHGTAAAATTAAAERPRPLATSAPSSAPAGHQAVATAAAGDDWETF